MDGRKSNICAGGRADDIAWAERVWRGLVVVIVVIVVLFVVLVSVFVSGSGMDGGRLVGVVEDDMPVLKGGWEDSLLVLLCVFWIEVRGRCG